jgi:hypothetical protein
VSPVKYELGFHISEDDILHSCTLSTTRDRSRVTAEGNRDLTLELYHGQFSVGVVRSLSLSSFCCAQSFLTDEALSRNSGLNHPNVPPPIFP